MKYSILLIVFILPLLAIKSLAFSFISVKTFFFYGVVDLAFVLFIYSLIVDKSYRLSRKQLLFFIPVILYVLWLSLAGVFASSPSLSFWGPMERGTGLLTLYHALAFSFILVSLINHEGKDFINKLLKYFLLGSFVLAISVWLGDEGFRIPYDVLLKSSGGGLVGNSSFTAAYFVFSVFFCIYLLFEKGTSKKWKVFTSFILATIIFSPLFINIHGLLTGKGLLGSARGATLGIIIGAGAILVFYLALSKRKILKILGIVGIFISLIVFSIGWSELMKPDTYLHNKFIEAASGTRFLFWDIAQKSMNEHPYFGYGPENYMIAFSKNFDLRILDDGYPHEAWSDKPHNIYFDTGVSGGYPAIVLYAVFLLSIFYAIYRAYRQGNISQAQASAMLGMFAAYIFQNLFIFDSPVSTVALFITLGVLLALQSEEEMKKKLPKVKIDKYILSSTAVALSISFVFAFIYFAYLPLKKARNFTRVISSDLDKRPAEYASLLSGSKAGDDYDASFFADSVYLSYRSHIKELQSDPRLTSYVDADLTAYLVYLNKLAETNKTDYRLYLSMLHLYNMKINIINKRYDPVEFEHIMSIVDQAHKLSPRDPQVYWETGFLMVFQENDLNKALSEYRNAINLDKTSPVSWRMMLKFLKMADQQKLFNFTLSEAQNSIPGFEYQPF